MTGPTHDGLGAYAADGTAPARGRRVRPRKEFIRGPLPLWWMARAAALRGQALAVSLAIWFRRGIEGAAPFPLYPSALSKLGVNRWSSYRALAALEKAGLIAVERRKGRCPVVTVLEASAPGDAPSAPVP